MLDILVKLWNVLSAIWRVIPEEKKKETVGKMADAMEEKFREYFKDAKGRAGEA